CCTHSSWDTTSWSTRGSFTICSGTCKPLRAPKGSTSPTIRRGTPGSTGAEAPLDQLQGAPAAGALGQCTRLRLADGLGAPGQAGGAGEVAFVEPFARLFEPARTGGGLCRTCPGGVRRAVATGGSGGACGFGPALGLAVGILRRLRPPG